MIRRFLPVSLGVALWPGRAAAHAAEQGFVLLLPWDVYITVGAGCVALTVLILALVPDGLVRAAFRGRALWRTPRGVGRHGASLLSAGVLVALVLAGLRGGGDPLTNPLPLTVWTVWWIGMVSVQGLICDHWRWTNPWTGPAALMARATGERAPLRYPRALGHWPGIVILVAFCGFLLADPAPADPRRLAVIVGGYWLAMLGGLALFGPVWLLRVEAVSILMRLYGRLAMLGRRKGRLALGLPGWRIARGPRWPLGAGLFALLLLGGGSFDGLNETFWWLGRIGVNPLEFPGRSAVIGSTLAGLVAADAALIAVFAVSTWLGVRLAGGGVGTRAAIRAFAPAILPIALGYHIAHYLVSFLVDGQYVLAWLSDPLGRGWDLLNLGAHSVTTGFLNSQGSVRAIWLSQAGAVVIGHVIAILLAHALALDLYADRRRAVLSQLPLAVFMVAYTTFGLWLLASPKGM
ncbi:hypothetical protein D6850_14290 [Roseovarius spongiae]|uniref:Fenitrothion hydrolase n=1 Tax=Roseovarius spongiae TaxID=2320272 RepID=A0A3A8B820_9RHOB|nr:hypothetical protein [Roseovarius spongiae]RKF13466.1 hypothetical protein D6850_14290 [Roseovarius spongiae]